MEEEERPGFEWVELQGVDSRMASGFLARAKGEVMGSFTNPEGKSTGAGGRRRWL